MNKRPRIKVGRHDGNALKGPRASDGRYYWQARLWVGGDRGRDTKAIGWLTEDEAIETLAGLVHRGGLDAEPRGPVSKPPTVRDLLETYMAARIAREDLDQLTKRNNTTARRRVERALGDVPLAELGLEALENYRDEALRGSASATVRLDLRILRQAWRWAKARRLVDRDLPRVQVLDRGDGREAEKARPHIDDVAVVEAKLRERWADGWPWRVFHVIAVTGARPSEVARLTVGDVDLEHRTIRIHGKRSPQTRKARIRTLAILADTVAALRPFVEGRASDARLWGPSPKSIANSLRQDHLPRACAEARVDPVKPLGLRRLATDTLRQRHVDPVVAAAILGNSPAVMVREYARASAEECEDAITRARLGRTGQVLPFAEREKA
jgi:integrase